MEETIRHDVEDEIAIERCRELLGHEGDDLSDEQVTHIGRHAEAMARIVIELFLENRSGAHQR
jgi:hypothetical protein